ncbi:MAG: chemotaxis protein CheR [Deltaproteobacteria bacterium]|nr:chemotaxis protein CheR [Deltaproteobacteria bacterium]
MDITPVIELLRTRIGLNAESIGVQVLEKAVRDCMAECGSASIEEYIQTLMCFPNEVDRLVESVVIPETYFFRDKELFNGFKEYLRQFWLDRKTSAPLRVLSVPCSTGEEPYSIAMLLFDMNIGRDRFHIDAVDISVQALDAAMRGVYTAYSFRGTDPSLCNRYFSKSAEGYVIKKEVSSAVNFQQGNILTWDFASMRAGYDVIFCRNLLIYFDNAAKKKAVSVLFRLLNGDGVLFVGHAETARLSADGFSRLAFPRAFAHRIGADPEHRRVVPCPSGHKEKLPAARAQGDAHRARVVSKKTEPDALPRRSGEAHGQDAAKSRTNAAERIAEAYRLVGAGDIDNALRICEDLVAHDSYSAQAYYILGQVVDSTGDGYLAEEYLKKAVYLDPGFHDALAYLSNLCERLGDAKNAARFGERAGRVMKRASGKQGR